MRLILSATVLAGICCASAGCSADIESVRAIWEARIATELSPGTSRAGALAVMHRYGAIYGYDERWRVITAHDAKNGVGIYSQTQVSVRCQLDALDRIERCATFLSMDGP
jgi:hypothetical protein